MTFPRSLVTLVALSCSVSTPAPPHLASGDLVARPAGATMQVGEDLTVRTTAVGRATQMRPVHRTDVASCGPEVPAAEQCLAHDLGAGAVAWWAAGPQGLMQGWTFAGAPAGSGALQIDVDFEGYDAVADADGHSAVLRGRERALTYGGLKAWDADGDVLAATMTDTGDGLRIAVDVDGARWPVTVDPVFGIASWDAEPTEEVAPLGDGSNLVVARAGDIDGDGRDDIAVLLPQREQLLVYLGGPTNPVEPPVVAPVYTQLELLQDAVARGGADLDGDGNDDVIVTGVVEYDEYDYFNFMNNIVCFQGEANCTYAPSFVPFSRVALFVGPTLNLIDNSFIGFSTTWTGDSAVLLDNPARAVRVVQYYPLEFESGGFYPEIPSFPSLEVSTATTQTTSQTIPLSWYGQTATNAGDVNGDGIEDLLVHGRTPDRDVGTAALHLGTSTGLQTSPVWTVFTRQTEDAPYVQRALAAPAGDVDGDGFDDVLIGDSESLRLSLYLGNGGGLDATPSWNGNGTLPASPLGDTNGDGFDDVVLRTFSEVQVFLGSASGLASGPTWTVNAGNPSGVGDVDGDGFEDLVVERNSVIELFHGSAEGLEGTVGAGADAGGPYTGVAGEEVVLDARGSAGSTSLVAHRWDCTDDGSFDTTGAVATCVYATPGAYVVRLEVEDDLGGLAEATANVTISSGRLAPIAVAGGPYAPFADTPFMLDGSASSDDAGITDWSWDLDGDGSEDANGATPTAMLARGTYAAVLTVTDADGLTGTAPFELFVGHTGPTADAGGPYTADGSGVSALDGSGSTDDGPLTYRWYCDSTSSAVSTTGVMSMCTFPRAGLHRVRLEVEDADGAIATDEAMVTVLGMAPTASISAGGTVSEGQPFELDGSGSTDDYEIVNWSWDCDGDGVEDVLGEQATCYFADDGTYDVTLTVTDHDGSQGMDTQSVVVDNVAPTATMTDTYNSTTEAVDFVVTASDVAADTITMTYRCSDADPFVPAAGLSFSCSYPTDGIYTATAQVSDEDGGLTVLTSEVDRDGDFACTGTTCAQVKAAVASANLAFGSDIVVQSGPARLRPSTFYNAIQTVLGVMATEGCLIEPVIELRAGGDYNTQTRAISGFWDGGEFTDARLLPGSRFEGMFEGGAAVGGIFARFNGRNQVIANTSAAGGYVVGRWARVSGARGVWIVAHGTCDGNTPPADALNTWFAGGTSGW